MLRVGIIGFEGIAKNANSRHYYDLEARKFLKPKIYKACGK